MTAVILTFAVTTGTALAAGSPKSATPKPGTSPAPASALATKAQAKLSLPDAFVVHRDVVTVRGRWLHVEGIVRPYVAGQWVEVQSSVAGKVFKTDRLRVKPSPKLTDGVFTEKLISPRAGIVHVAVTHQPTAQMLGFEARRAVAALNPTGPGSGGRFVDLIQQRLVALHFYLPLSGVYGLQTRLAVDAYHRLLRRGTSQTLDPATLTDLLNGRGAFTVRDPHDGTHVEGDLGNQLLALIYGSKVYRIYPMYDSDFFYRGYAIHGYDPAPDYPASHGCMRLPMSDAVSVWNWLTYGVTVDVYQ